MSSINHYFQRHWIITLSIILGVFVLLPFLAPIFMHLGLDGPGRGIYFIYSWLCHQLPMRSYFLFGSNLTYSLSEIQQAWQVSTDPGVLRQFIGNPSMGWKVAWSDRMVSMYTSWWIFGLLWWPLRLKLKKLPIWGLILFLLPMAADGISHFLSELSGLGQGFRDQNLWLTVLTRNYFPPSFYSGDALGSFNSLMRILTGILFGLAIVWYTYPYLDKALSPLQPQYHSQVESEAHHQMR